MNLQVPIKGGEFLGQQSTCHLLKDSAIWSYVSKPGLITMSQEG